MDLDALRFAEFTLLDEAVEGWNTMVRDLEELEESAEKGLRRKAATADWCGVNATVSKEFIGRTAGEFKDAHTQAESIRNILRDTCRELKAHRRKLEEAIGRGLKKNLTVTSSPGGGFAVTMNVHPDRAAKGTTVPEHEASDVAALRDEVQKILDAATEVDTSADKVLRALADQSRHGFSDAAYKDRDAAAGAVRKADELARLALRDPAGMTVAEFDRLTAGLAKYSGDELFAARFATRAGAQGTLDFWADFNRPGAHWRLSEERHGDFGDLQRNLALTLATASRSDSPAMAEWKRQVVELGDRPVGAAKGVLGLQVMSNLLRWGDYDDRFLNEYGEKLIETEKRLTDNGREAAWNSLPASPRLDHTGTDSGTDPMTGFLKGLSNSPAAATEFLNGTFVTKHEDHDFTADTDGNGKEGRRSLTNFEYLFEERSWPHDTDSEGNKSIAGRNHLALALEAATTGHPAGELPTADTPPHTAEQAKLMERLVTSIAEDPERLTDHGYMSDSIGQITSEYLPDLNRALSDVRRDPDSDDWQDIERLYPVAGAEAALDHTDVSKLLFTIGQNPEGYAAVEVGQKIYMAQLMDYHLDPDLPPDRRFSNDHELCVRHIASRSGEVSGMLALGQREAIGAEASDTDKEFEHCVAQYKNLISGGVGTAVGVGTSFIATPWVGAAAGGAAGTLTSVVLESAFREAEGEAMNEAGKTGGQVWQDGLFRSGKLNGDAAMGAAQRHHSVDEGDAGEWARESSRQGYMNASAFLQGQAPDSITPYS